MIGTSVMKELSTELDFELGFASKIAPHVLETGQLSELHEKDETFYTAVDAILGEKQDFCVELVSNGKRFLRLS